MHGADQVDSDESLVQALLADQYPEWAALPIERVHSDGTDNAIYRLGDDLVVRMPLIGAHLGRSDRLLRAHESRDRRARPPHGRGRSRGALCATRRVTGARPPAQDAHRTRGSEGEAMVELADRIAQVFTGKPGVFGLYARNLETNETVAINGDRVFPAESAAKTFILAYYSRLVESGAIDPTTRIPLDDEIRQIGTGVLRYLADGLEPTRDDLAWLMIIVSDNTATAMLMRSLDVEADVNAVLHDMGYPTANLNVELTVERALAGEPFSTSSPRDLAEVYAQLDDRCRALLFRQQHLIGLPRRLPHMAYAADVDIAMPIRVYNKTGNGAGTFVDSGRFETDQSAWIVAAMAAEQTDFASRADDIAPTAFGQVGEMLYDAWG